MGVTGTRWVWWLPLVNPPDHWNHDGTIESALANPEKWGASKAHAIREGCAYDEEHGVVEEGRARCGAKIPHISANTHTDYGLGDDLEALTMPPCKRCASLLS